MQALTSGNGLTKIVTRPEGSDIESTNTSLGWRQLRGMLSACGWTVTANPGPEVRGSPSFWYFGWPIAFSRRARAKA
jgi:hypothetical protein